MEHSRAARRGGRGEAPRRPVHLALGLQRVLGVRVVLTDRGAVSEAIGVLRRRPVVQRISLTTAAGLVARGAPFAVRSSPPSQRPPAPGAARDAVAEER